MSSVAEPPDRLKRIARTLFEDRELFWILAAPASAAPVPVLPDGYTFVAMENMSENLAGVDAELAGMAWYGGPDARMFALVQDGRPDAICCYWYGPRYETQRNFWPLRERQAKLVQITTAPARRRRGLAAALIAASVPAMRAAGFDSLYARVWWNHKSSLHAFSEAHWRKIAFIAGCRPLGLPLCCRLCVPPASGKWSHSDMKGRLGLRLLASGRR